MRKVIAVIGNPGTGKTTLMRKILALHSWERMEPAKLVPTLFCNEKDIHVLGKYEEGEVFAGTDKMSMACQPNVIEFMKKDMSSVLFEGDRLSSMSFLESCLDLPGTELHILLLTTTKEEREARYASRGSNQNEQFLRGRETKYNNIQANMILSEYITEFDNSTTEAQTTIIERIEALINS